MLRERGAFFAGKRAYIDLWGAHWRAIGFNELKIRQMPFGYICILK